MARISRRLNGPTAVAARAGCCLPRSKSRRCCQPDGPPSTRRRVDCCVSRRKSSTGPARSPGARNIHIRCRRGVGPRTGLVLQHEVDCALDPFILMGGGVSLHRHVVSLIPKIADSGGGLLSSNRPYNAGRHGCVVVEHVVAAEFNRLVEVVDVVRDLAYHISMLSPGGRLYDCDVSFYSNATHRLSDNIR